MESSSYRIGVISDTHGHLSAAAAEALKGVRLIIHAGDLDTPDVLEALRKIAPVVVVRGNMDHGPWAKLLPPHEMIEIEGVGVYIQHIGAVMDLDPAAAGVSLVINGHTHRPSHTRNGGVTYLNPGSASWPRDSQGASLAIVTLRKGTVDVRWVSLDV